MPNGINKLVSRVRRIENGRKLASKTLKAYRKLDDRTKALVEATVQRAIPAKVCKRLNCEKVIASLDRQLEIAIKAPPPISGELDSVRIITFLSAQLATKCCKTKVNNHATA